MNTSSEYIPNFRNPSNGYKDHGLIYKISLYSLLIFTFTIPWADGVFDGLVRIFGLLSIGMASFYLVTSGTHKNYSYFHISVVFLWGWIILSVAWTPSLESGLIMAPRLFQLMFLPFLLTLILNNRTSHILAYQSYVLGNFVGSSIILYNYLNGIESPYYGRYTIQNIETDTMSIILALAIPMAAFLTSVLKNKWMRMINTLFIPFIVFAIFLTGTRTGSIVAIIGILYWLYTHKKASAKIKFTIFVMFIISIFAILNLAPKASVDRVFSAGKSIQSGSLNYRTVIWSASLSQWKTSPIIGTGLGGLGHVLSREHVNYEEAHNTHLQILVENGIIGVLFYILLELSILLLILKVPPNPEKTFLLALFFSVLVSQLTLHTHLQKETWLAFTMLVIHSLSLSRHAHATDKQLKSNLFTFR